MNEKNGTIVQNKEQAYGYKYSSLASLYDAGINIPQMRIDATGEFVEYFKGGEWLRGAKIVVPEVKGMNAAQAYGSALTYARRYTVMMAESVVCTDDQLLETQEPEKKPEPKPAPKEAPKPVPKEAQTFTCAACGKELKPYQDANGKEISVRQHAAGSEKKFGEVLCLDCIRVLHRKLLKTKLQPVR